MADHRRSTVRAPRADLRAWSAAGRWLDPEQTQQAVERHEAVLVTNEAGELHTLDELPAPMTAVLRIDADLLQLADRLDDLAEQLGR